MFVPFIALAIVLCAIVHAETPTPNQAIAMPTLTPPTTVQIPKEPRERAQPAPTWRVPEYASPNNGVTQFSQAQHHAPPPSHPSAGSSSNSAVKKAEDHAKKAGTAANRMSMNPMDLFLRMQFQNAMNQLNRTMKELAAEVKKGSVSSGEVRQIQTKLANVFEQHAQSTKAGEFLREHAKEGFGVLGAAVADRARGIREDLRVNVSSSAASSSAATAASAPAGEVVDLDRRAEVQSLANGIDDTKEDAATASNSPTAEESTGALKQMDTLLVPGSTAAVARDAATIPENAKETVSASILAATRGRGIRLADASVGDGATEAEKTTSKEETTESEEEARLHEEQLASGGTIEFYRDEAQEVRPAREPASMGFLGKKLPFKIRRADGRAVSSFSELSWEDLAYFGGRLALLTVITCVSLCLLAFYLGSTLAARRRAAEEAPEVPYDPPTPPPPYA